MTRTIKRNLEKGTDWKIPFIDVLVGFLFLFIVLNICLMSLIKPDDEKKSNGLDLKAEYIITVTWPDDQDCDVDTWTHEPTGTYINFVTKSNAFITLDRDDRGIIMDTYDKDGVTYRFPDNKEITTIRKNIPGTYGLNVHLYNCRPGGIAKTPGDDYQLDATVEIIKLNPKVETVFKKTVKFSKIWEELTVLHFDINDTGNFKEIDNTFEKMVDDNSKPVSSAPFSSIPGGVNHL